MKNFDTHVEAYSSKHNNYISVSYVTGILLFLDLHVKDFYRQVHQGLHIGKFSISSLKTLSNSPSQGIV